MECREESEDYDDAATVRPTLMIRRRGAVPRARPDARAAAAAVSYGAVTAIAQLGADIDGEAEGDGIGRSVALSGTERSSPWGRATTSLWDQCGPCACLRVVKRVVEPAGF